MRLKLWRCIQIYANLLSTGLSVGLVGIFHEAAAISLYFVLASGRHNPFSKACEFIIRCIRVLAQGDRQQAGMRPALALPCLQTMLVTGNTGRQDTNMSQTANRTTSMPPAAAIAL